jgi:hypothetical protein
MGLFNIINPKIIIICLLEFYVFSGLSGQVSDDMRLQKLMAEMISCKSNGEGMSVGEVALADSIKYFGPGAIPSLLALLKHPDEKVRERASYTLREIEGLNETHLDDLIKSLKRGQSWHACRIAEIGTPKAYIALIEAMKKEHNSDTQITFAFEVAGRKGLPYLFKLICDQNFNNQDLEEAVASVFRKLGPVAHSYIFKLDSLAISSESSIASRKWAITCLGSIGPDADSAATDLYQLSIKGPGNFQKYANSALQEMHSKYVVIPLINRMESTNNSYEKALVMRDIAELHEAGQSAGSELLPYLNNEAWNLRISAAITLGYIKYLPACDELMKALCFEPDCRLNFVAAVALGKFRSKSALQILKNTAYYHWNPMVRKAAKISVHQIEDTTFIPPSKKYSTFGEEFFSYEMDAMMYPWCKLDSCRYEKELQVPEGRLICINDGEFGGRLLLKDNFGVEKSIQHGNFCAIYSIQDKIITVNGLAHLSIQSGYLCLVEKNPDGHYSAEKILALPGAPLCSKIAQNGNLLINTLGGTVELTGDLKLVSSDCLK